LKETDFAEKFVDVKKVFAKTKCRIIQKAIIQGKKILAVKLPKFAGLLGLELSPGLRLGTELADRARFWGKVGGILHSDELLSYDVSEEEISMLKGLVGVKSDDAVVIVADTEENAADALRAVVERAREALMGVPEETRAANPDGTSRYMRPRPGAARMYPETDLPPITITQEYVEKLRSSLPEPLEQKAERFMRKYSLNEKLVWQLLNSEYDVLFEDIIDKTAVSPAFVAATLTETFKALKREGVEIDNLTDDQIIEVFKLVGSEKTSKEAIPEIITWLSEHEDARPINAVKALGLAMISEKELKLLIDEFVKKNEKIIKDKGQRAFGALMAAIMKEFRGKVKTELVSEILKEKLSKNKE
jgi:glutamyl-tRNA(Gln) amidotransferase subunit E